jgi:hypothetical protein
MLRNECDACKDGYRWHITNYTHNSRWLKAIPADTDFLVMNMGAWYSLFGHILNSTDRYEETLRLVLVPAVQDLLTRFPNLKVFWTDLPPYIKAHHDSSMSQSSSAEEYCAQGDKALTNLGGFLKSASTEATDGIAQYTEAQNIQRNRLFLKCMTSMNARNSIENFEWHLLRDKDALAKKYLTPLGVNFLDTKPALIPRKTMDPEVSVDGIHWWYVSVLPAKHFLYLLSVAIPGPTLCPRSWRKHCSTFSC